MRKKEEFIATVVNSRNEFIDATTLKKPIILIQGSLLEEIRVEIKKERKSKKFAGGIGALGIASIIGWIIYPPSGIISAIATIFTTGYFTLSSLDLQHLFKYSMFQIGDYGQIGLVYKGCYNYEQDKIVKPFSLNLCDGKKCPKCKAKLSKDFYFGYCPKCQTKLAAVRKLK